MSAFNHFVDAPEHLLAAHDRLRGGGLPVITLINAHSPLDAKVWLCRWASARGRVVVVAPETNSDAALAAYRARLLSGRFPHRGLNAPLLLVPGEFQEALASTASLSRTYPALPLVVTCGLAQAIDCLLDTSTPMELVIAALQGLVSVEDTSAQVVKTVVEARQAQPFLRGACEGLLYYMLEARSETRGRFTANARMKSTIGNRSHEVDLACVDAQLVIEIDGPEHNGLLRKRQDAKKQRDLESQGYRVRRFSNEQVIEDPVGVWRLIAEHLSARAAG
jgi:very-short-patch-repair endonuclease